MNGLLNSGRLFGLRRITIFLSGRRINARDFKSRGNKLLPADHTAHRALVPLVMRGVRRYPATARWCPNRWLLAHHRQLPLVVILWRVGGCSRIQFWILVDPTAAPTRCWCHLPRGAQRVVEVREVRLVETVYGVLRDLLLIRLLALGSTSVDVWGRSCFMGLLDVW